MRRLGEGCLIGFGVLIALAVIMGSLLLSTGTRTTDSTGQPVEIGGATVAVYSAAAPAFGQDVQVGEVRWKVLEAEVTKELKPEYGEVRTTGGKFIRVRFEMENISKEMLSFVGMDLVDDQNREFKPMSERFQFAPPGEACSIENLNPNVPKTCTLFFELPDNAANVKAKVGDLEAFGSGELLIGLGF